MSMLWDSETYLALTNTTSMITAAGTYREGALEISSSGEDPAGGILKFWVVVATYGWVVEWYSGRKRRGLANETRSKLETCSHQTSDGQILSTGKASKQLLSNAELNARLPLRSSLSHTEDVTVKSAPVSRTDYCMIPYRCLSAFRICVVISLDPSIS